MTERMAVLDASLCACSSGLRRVRCCGFDAVSGPDPAHYPALDGVAETMLKARGAGRNREAERQALALLDLAPLHRQALSLLFELRRDEGRIAAAEALIRRLVATDPPAAQFFLLHAQLLINQGRHAEADAPARAALRLTPHDTTAQHLIGIILTETGGLLEGETHYRLALAPLNEPDAVILGNLAWNLKLQGRLAEAAALYDSLLNDKPQAGHSRLRNLAGAAQVQAALGNLDHAHALLAEALARSPDNRTIGVLDALMRLRSGDASGALAAIEATAARSAPQPLVGSEWTAKGQALEALGRDEEAFAAYRAGRAVHHDRAGRRFDAVPLHARAAALRETYVASLLAALPRPAPSPGQPTPVFLLGVRRSGTVLLEQLLAQAPGVDPADERAPLNECEKLLPRLVQGLSGIDRPYPAALGETLAGGTREVLPILAGRYLGGLAKAGITNAETRFVTDRAPDLVWTLGLAGLLFPTSPVIHLLRHPLDVVLSGFTQDRLYEGDAGASFESLATLYDIQMSMIGHFRGQMTLRYLPVRYEELVTDPAAVLTRICAFIGVTADASEILAAPPRPVPRAPVHQILREPPHRRSLYRHRKFGPALLGPEFEAVMAVLAPWIERLGYAAPLRQAA